MPKIWSLAPANVPPHLDAWAEELGISSLVVRLLWQRGLSDLISMDRYLSPGLRHLVHPHTCPGLEEAAGVLAQGLAEGRPFAIWGDYDVDGVTSTALVTDFLRQRGYEVRPYIPSRHGEGYGLNLAGIEKLASEGIRLLLTVDCGISCTAEVARARELGMVVVVSDHHLPGPVLPEADGLCNPRLAPCSCETLAGVGVAFMLMAALNRLLPGEPADMRRFLDLVALGTLADIVDLHEQNRILVKNGLLLLGEATRPGISALKEVGGFNPAAVLTAGQVVFSLAPRINAAGRMGEAMTALSMLLAKDRDEAKPLAAVLDALNRDRQAEEEAILQEALAQAAEQAESRLGLVLHAPSWHHGVIGIVASRVVERYYRPVLIATSEGDILKGSGRSVPEFNLHQGLEECREALLGFGGHRQAAGFSLEPGNLERLRELFHEAARRSLGETPLAPTLKVDAELSFGAIDFTLLKELELLQPYGPANPEPLFISPPCEVRGCRAFGKGHLSLQLKDKTTNITLKAKAWRVAREMGNLTGRTIRVAFIPKIDRYNGLASIELTVKDWNLA